MASSGSVGCVKGCLGLFAGLIVICFAIAIIPFAGAALFGVGLWFLVRFIWRRLAVEAPETSFVQWGMGLAPIMRKVIAAVPCVLLVLFMFVGIAGASSSSSSKDTASEQKTEQTTRAVQETEKSQQEEEEKEESQLSDLKATFIDVGQGDAALLQLPDGQTLLVDAGPDATAKAVKETLSANGISKIDYVVATHPDTDHIAGMSEVLASYGVGQFYTAQVTQTTDSYIELLQAVKDKGIEAHAAWAGSTIASGDDWSVKILSPAEMTVYSESNDWSVVILVTYKDTSMLLTGDAPKEILKGLDAGKVDLLKVSHHGSDTGTDTDLVSALNPRYAVISYAEGNEYGHPTQAVLDALKSTSVYGTGANGTITAVSDGKKVTVSSEKSAAVVAGTVAAAEEQTATEEQPVADEAPAEETPVQETAQGNAATEKTVVITPSGKKYHNRGCRTLKKSKSLTELTVSEAQAQGYEACKVCNP